MATGRGGGGGRWPWLLVRNDRMSGVAPRDRSESIGVLRALIDQFVAQALIAFKL